MCALDLIEKANQVYIIVDTVEVTCQGSYFYDK